jgi:hypothetical protein
MSEVVNRALRGSLAALLSLVLLAPVFVAPMHADDEAIAIAAGGIQPRKETRILMQKERLTIGLDKVTVDFWFLNESSKDVTTEVGFPVPPYQWNTGEPGYVPDFSNFRVWANGQEVKYKTDVRAKLNGKDYTDLLRRLHLPIDFANSKAALDGSLDPQQPISSLSSAEKAELLRSGLIQPETVYTWNYDYEWYDYRTYYWVQMFPARQIIHIRHEYKPETGYRGFAPDKFHDEMERACLSPAAERNLIATSRKNLEARKRLPGDSFLYARWVKYILTSANTWKTPIKDFELIVEKPKAATSAAQAPYLVSFCWNGKVQQTDQGEFVARAKDFVPKNELTVYFLLNY